MVYQINAVIIIQLNNIRNYSALTLEPALSYGYLFRC